MMDGSFEKRLSVLRQRIAGILSHERMSHTIGVEQTAGELAGIYCPQLEYELRVAALLHDVTKEWSIEGHLEMLKKHGVDTELYINAPATLHAVTAAMLIPEDYPEYATDTVISAVRYHTTGKADMTLAEKIIYIADFIEPNRRFEGCIRLRSEFFDKNPHSMTHNEAILHLDRVILKSLESTLGYLSSRGGQISPDTEAARQYLDNQLKKNGEI